MAPVVLTHHSFLTEQTKIDLARGSAHFHVHHRDESAVYEYCHQSTTRQDDPHQVAVLGGVKVPVPCSGDRLDPQHEKTREVVHSDDAPVLRNRIAEVSTDPRVQKEQFCKYKVRPQIDQSHGEHQPSPAHVHQSGPQVSHVADGLLGDFVKVDVDAAPFAHDSVVFIVAYLSVPLGEFVNLNFSVVKTYRFLGNFLNTNGK
jgi:hypothetical protein